MTLKDHRIAMEKERRAMEECNCTVTQVTNVHGYFDPIIKYCPKHAAADAMLEALKTLTKAYGASDGRNGNSGECWDCARRAIRLATDPQES